MSLIFSTPWKEFQGRGQEWGTQCSGKTERRTLQRNIFKRRFDMLDILYNPISKKVIIWKLLVESSLLMVQTKHLGQGKEMPAAGHTGVGGRACSRTQVGRPQFSPEIITMNFLCSHWKVLSSVVKWPDLVTVLWIDLREWDWTQEKRLGSSWVI